MPDPSSKHSFPKSMRKRVKKKNCIGSATSIHLQFFTFQIFLVSILFLCRDICFNQIENNTQKLKEEAERNLITLMEEEERLRSKVMCKKRQCLLLEKQQQLNDLLDLQVMFIHFRLLLSLNVVNVFHV